MKIKGDPNCMRCGLCENAETVCLMGRGPVPNDIMIIGEAPGTTEDEEGEAFIGRSGKLIGRLLRENGLELEEVYVTNTVHCRPPDNRTPSKREIRECKFWLDHEIEKVKPKFILMLGNVPLEALTGKKGIKKARGVAIEEPDRILFPAYHPAYAMYDAKQMPVFERDIKTFAEITRRGGVRKEKGLNYKIVTSENFDEFAEDIADNDFISYDSETSGLNPYAPGAWVTSMGFGTRDVQWCVPLNHTESPIYRRYNRQSRLVRRIDKLIRNKKLIMHNGKFDTQWAREVYGVYWPCYFDTMLAHYNLDENSLHGLDILAGRHFNAMDYDIPVEEKWGFGPLNRHCEYLALDIFYTRKLWKKFKRDLKQDNLTNTLFWKLTMPVARMFADIERNGVYVDPNGLEEAHEYWTKRAASSLRKLNELVPDDRKWKNKKTKEWNYGINWGSPKQLAEVLFDRLGLTPIEKTKSGKSESTSESVLLRLQDQHEVPKLVLEYREATKNLNTFVEAWQRAAVNNRLHPTFKLHGTVTGRPSCEDPNLQQTPRDPRIRSLITAPPGWTLVEADFSQIELRLVAEDSRDPQLLFAYQTGMDVHTLTVQSIFNIQEPTDEERKKGKAINFGFIYGMGWFKFMEYARDNYGQVFTERESKTIRKGFFRQYSGLPEWHKRKRRFAAQEGYVRNPLGRKRRLPAAMYNDESKECQEALRQAINSPIQSFASDLNLMSAVELWEKMPSDKFRIVGTVHDAILFEVRNDYLDTALPIIKHTMEGPQLLDELRVKLSVPLISEVKTGPWSKGVKWKEAA